MKRDCWVCKGRWFLALRITGKARRFSKGQALDDLIPEEVMRAVGGYI